MAEVGGPREDPDSWIDAAWKGDAQALSELFEQHLPALRGFARSRVGRALLARESISDLVQSACREVIKDLPLTQPENEARFRRLLFLAVERKMVDHVRFHGRQKREPERTWGSVDGSSADSPEARATDLTPSKPAMAQEVQEKIARALQKLPEDQREVIRLSRVVGLSRAEIARTMDRSPAAIRELLHRALARLDRLLREKEH
jgi:RNA polymerase sigma-70 factor (ECF subfamily)